jgi:hypothetical protein
MNYRLLSVELNEFFLENSFFSRNLRDKEQQK